VKRLRVAAAQINSTVGDLAGNSAQIVAAARKALASGAALLVTPELALTGYPPEDLLLLPDFARACEAAFSKLLAQLPSGIDCLIGLPRWTDRGCVNAAAWVRDQKVVQWYAKTRLPNESVFDEHRYFVPGDQPLVVDCRGVRVAVLICEDLWHPAPLAAAAAEGFDLAVALNASPFHRGKEAEREVVVRARCQEQRCAVLYVNAVGGQDELVFDGSSFAVAADGTLAWRGPAFAESLALLTWEGGEWRDLPPSHALLSVEEAWWQALVLAIRDYVTKNRFPGAVIGLSGGIDSALVACIATAALGPERVRTVMMPSPYSAKMSLEDAALLASRLGVRHEVIPIAPAMTTFAGMLASLFAGLPADTTEENLQARFRAALLMAISNKTGALVLTTGNKSELATGYCTLYGDMAGGFAVIKDLYKTEVYRLARWINRHGEVIPVRILERPPSAELRPNQVDQERLPPYEVLDAILYRYLEERQEIDAIVAAGFAPETVAQVVGLLHGSEYKRQQAPLGPRLTRCAFGRDWRMPVTSSFRPSLSKPTLVG
jgi:NAD+ synthase/NAD+ synthase (glutamine-hydrolysing)